MSAVVLYVTCADAEQAARIGGALVSERLAACANILGEVRSFYWWEGQVQDDREVALILKTDAPLVPRATARIKALHSYTVPCVVAVPIVGGNADFLDWIGRETSRPF